MDIKPKDEIEIYIEDGSMILKKAVPACAFCGAENGLLEIDEKHICGNCALKIRNITV